ncbi:MAG: transglutaminase-like domain-containing protein, partial [Pseudobdellovibrio sp.]
IDDKKYLKIPTLPPKTTEWIEETKKKNPTLQARLNALIAFFEKPGFIYTLKPDTYNNLDQFLFDKKKGYCEHYAAAFATMARGLEIPSRVVIGYQGGTYNALSDFWKVSQRDAHAWVEVGLNNSWKRVDPTGLVSQLRISMGSADFFALSEAEQLLFSKDKKINTSNELRNFYVATMSVIDSLNYNWTLFLLNYDLQAQLDILKNIQLSGFFIFFVLFLAIFLIFFVVKNKKDGERPKHRLQSLYYKIENWAKLHGIAVEINSTPIEILNAIGRQFPETGSFVDKFVLAYENTVYRESGQITSDKELKREWNQLIKQRK